MRKAALSITVLAVVALVAVFQMQPVRADSGAVSPGKPSNVSAEYQGESSISVSWNASPRESAGILYEVFYRPSGASEWTSATAAYTGSRGGAYSINDPIVVPSLGEYQVRVKACNYYVGSNVLCDDSAVATVQVGVLPAKPAGLALTQVPPNHDIDVTWDAVEDADNYKIRWRAKDDTLGDPIYATTTQATIQLDKYGEWIVRLEACNDAGCGRPASKTITTTALPPKPTGIVMEQRADYSRPVFRMEWDPVPGTFGHYGIYASKSSGERVSSGVFTVFRPYFTYDEMAWWWKYGYGDFILTLTSCNSAGCTSVDVPITLVKPPPPANPTGLEVSQASEGSLQVDVELDSVEFAAKYKIRWRKAGPGNDLNEGITRSANAGSGTVSAQVTVDEYDSWFVRVDACNSSGCASASSRVNVEGTTPSRISNFEARDAEHSDTAMAVSWDETPHTTRYEIKWRKRGEKFKHGDILEAPGNQTSAVIELPDSHDWIVRARACNVNLCGPAVTESVSVTVVVDVPVVAEIQNLTVAAKWTSLYVNAGWKRVDGATYYKVWYADTVTGPMVPHIITYSAHAFYLPGHGTWDFLVQACNDDGCFASAHRLLKVYPPEE